MFKLLEQWFNCVKNIPLILRYGLILSIGIISLKTLEYQLFSYRFSMELYSGLLAVFFLFVGLATGLGWLQLQKQKRGEKNGTGYAEESKPKIDSDQPLTVTERKILSGLIQGLSNQQLADLHHVSINTVKTHLKKIYKKLSVSSRAAAVAKAEKRHFT